MVVASCPCCDEVVRLPVAELPADSIVQCPWCSERASGQKWAASLPPVASVFQADGSPLPCDGGADKVTPQVIEYDENVLDAVGEVDAACDLNSAPTTNFASELSTEETDASAESDSSIESQTTQPSSPADSQANDQPDRLSELSEHLLVSQPALTAPIPDDELTAGVEPESSLSEPDDELNTEADTETETQSESDSIFDDPSDADRLESTIDLDEPLEQSNFESSDSESPASLSFIGSDDDTVELDQYVDDQHADDQHADDRHADDRHADGDSTIDQLDSTLDQIEQAWESSRPSNEPVKDAAPTALVDSVLQDDQSVLAEKPKRVPIAEDQTSYYERHRAKKRRPNASRIVKMAAPTLLSLPIVCLILYFSGLNIGFYPFDGSGNEPETLADTTADLTNDLTAVPSTPGPGPGRTPATAFSEDSSTLVSPGDTTLSTAQNDSRDSDAEVPQNTAQALQPTTDSDDATVSNEPAAGDNGDAASDLVQDLGLSNSIDTTDRVGELSTGETSSVAADPASGDDDSAGDDDAYPADVASLFAGDKIDQGDQAGDTPVADNFDDESSIDAVIERMRDQVVAATDRIETSDPNRVSAGMAAEKRMREQLQMPDKTDRPDLSDDDARRAQIESSLLVFPSHPPKVDQVRQRDKNSAAETGADQVAQSTENPSDSAPRKDELPATEPVSPEMSVELKRAIESVKAVKQLDSASERESTIRRLVAFRDVSTIGDLLSDQPQPGIQELFDLLIEPATQSNLEPLCSEWVGWSGRPTAGMLLFGELQVDQAEPKMRLEDGSFLEVELAQHLESTPSGRVVAIGIILSSENAPRVRLVAGRTLD